MRRLLFATLVLVVFTPTQSAESAVPARASLIVGDNAVSVVDAIPGATYYFVGFGRRREGVEVTRRYFRLTSARDETSSGRVDLEVPEGVPDLSYWAAVSRDGGPILTAISPHFPNAHPIVRDDDLLTEGPEGPLLLSGDQVVGVFRRGVGAWVWNGVAAVVPSDDETVPDRYLLSAEGFLPLSVSDPAFDQFAPGDRIFAIDQTNFDIRRLDFAGEAQ